MSRFEDLSVGDIVVGEVTGVAPWGVFVRITDDTEGLLAGDTGPRRGDRVRVRIVEIDAARHRVGLANV
jgi:predicted RNA-binding protein with RPS1 domain